MESKWFYGALILFSTFISAISQVMLKKAAVKKYDSRIQEYLNAPVICAYLIFILATVMTVYSYKGLEVSQGTLLETSSYIFIFIFDVLIFRQKMTGRKAAGAILIVTGILLTVLM